MPVSLLLATKNVKKVREMREILSKRNGLTVLSAADFQEISEPEETGETFADNARQKALYYAGKSGLLALADDSGLVVDALMGRPGVYSSRYGSTDAERIARLLTEMDGVPDENRTARFQCSMALAIPSRLIAETEGKLEGMIAREMRGAQGFGYDPVFYVPELACHLAEVDAATKNAISHRGRALHFMLPHLVNSMS